MSSQTKRLKKAKPENGQYFALPSTSQLIGDYLAGQIWYPDITLIVEMCAGNGDLIDGLSPKR